MLYYHGTIAQYAKSILVSGLNPEPLQAFHVDRIPVPEGRIYLTRNPAAARMFAQFRADYERTRPGQYMEKWERWKHDDAPYHAGMDLTPTVLEIDVPEGYRLEPDPDSVMGAEFRCECFIPPELIRGLYGQVQ